MKPGRVIAISFVGAVAVAAAWFLFVRGGEPTYRGRTVTSWLGQVFDTRRNQAEALQALRQLGAQAVPFEISALTRTNSALERWYQSVYHSLPLRKYLPTPVAPETIRSAAELALLNNQHVGEFIPDIVRLLQHEDPSVRARASGILVNHIRARDTFCIPLLIEALNSPQPNVRRNLVLALTKFGPAAKAAVPALEQGLKADLAQIRIDCARALGAIDANTATVTKPVLKEAMGDGDPRIRHWASVYLSGIDAEDQEVMPVFIGSLTNSDPGIRMSAAYSLVRFGSKAKTAVPGLIVALTDPEASVRRAARAALEKIDPESAAKAAIE